MITPRLTVVLVAAAAVVALAGCSAPPAAPPTTQPAAPAVIGIATPTPGVFDASLAYQTAWHVDLASTYVNGSADVCDLNLGILIEDASGLADADATVPVYSVVMQHSGDVSYGTVWPTAVAGTGITDGTAKVAFTYDDQGLPTVGQGTADLTWHDASQTPAKTHRSDQIHVTFTAEPRAKVCP
jgi:hypothetical protein